MKRYYSITIFAIIVIAMLQVYGIHLQYQNYVNTQVDIVKTKLKVSIDEEYAIRAHKRHQPFKGGKQRLFYKMMTDKEVKEMAPPTKKIISLNEINIQLLRDKGIVETEADVLGLLSKDVVSHTGNVINLQKLSLIFKNNLRENYPYTLYLLDENKNVIKYLGQTRDTEGWQSCMPIAVGLKPLRFVSVKIDITPSSFIKNSILTLLLSVSLALIVIFCVGYQMTVIRRKEFELKNRAISIHGTIHDLKAPLASVLLMLSFVKDEIKDVELCDLMEKAELQIKRLSCRIKSLLITAKAEECKLLLNREYVDVASLVTSAKEQLLSQFWDIHPVVCINDNRMTKIKVYVDCFLLENVIYNLMENAVKYSELAAKVEVNIDENDRYLSVCVKDYGIGIEKKYQNKIFNQFYRIPNDLANSGYGIGLAMARYVVNAHGGSIKVDSEKDNGSAFTIILPLNNRKL